MKEGNRINSLDSRSIESHKIMYYAVIMHAFGFSQMDIVSNLNTLKALW